MSEQLKLGRIHFDANCPQIMGILNVTPDSFSDGGQFNRVSDALRHTERMLVDGATIIDMGAESTRPGAALVDEKTELERLLPVIDAISKEFDCCLSIDTNKPNVMREVLSRGVSMINDVRGFTTAGAFDAVVDSEAAICMMHMQGLPKTMQISPSYRDVVEDVRDFLFTQAKKAMVKGIAASRIIIDPGFGFGKTPTQNLQLLKHLDELATHFPVLIGMSRKSTLGIVLGDDTADRTTASVMGAMLAIQNGASIVRVHDVKQTTDAIKLYQAYLKV